VLILRGADVNGHDVEHAGDSPLSEAVQSGFEEMVDLLISAGADPSVAGWMWLTPFDRAQSRVETDPTEVNRRILACLLGAGPNNRE
jgi:ankyrin repeat protein